MKSEFRKRENSDTHHWLSDGKVAVGVMIGLLLALAFWLLVDARSIFFAQNVVRELVPTLAIALIAAVSLLVSFIALSEQRRMRQAGTDPVLIAHLDQRGDEPIVMDLKISNVGAGAAMNVEVVIQEPANAKNLNLWSDLFSEDVLQGNRKIKVILQGSSVKYSMGTGPELIGKGPLQPFEVKLSYQDIEGSLYSSSHGIDVREFDGRPANQPPLTKIWRQLEKIQKKMPKQ